MYKIKYILWLIIACITTTIHANDLYENATQLTLNIATEGSTIGAGTEWANSCNYNKSSVWYKFTPQETGDYNIKINEIVNNSTQDESISLYNDVLTLYSSNDTTNFNDLNEIICFNDDEFGFAGENLYINLDADTTYYIMVSSADCLFGKTEGKFSIEVKKESRPTVTGEECGDAIEIDEDHLCETDNTYSLISGSNINASKANPQPSCYDYAGASIWYKVTAATDKMQISTAPNFSEIITVYKGGCGNLEEIVCDINKISHDLEEGQVYSNTLTITDLEIDTTYFIQISGTFASIEAAFDSTTTCNDNIPYISISVSNDIICPSLGTPCNDGNSNTISDRWNDNCECIGTCPSISNAICDDGNPNTGNFTLDTTDYVIKTIHTVIDTAYMDADSNFIDTTYFDITYNILDTMVIDTIYIDHWDENCECSGTCNLGDNDCPNGYVNANCECECNTTECPFGEYLDDNCTCQICPTAGTTCDDGYYYTTNDVWTEWCTCVGELPDFCPADLTIYDEDVTDEGYFQTSNSIITDGSDNASVVVDEDEQFALNAKEYITLKPGFNAKIGSNFRAYIEGCDFDLKTDESTFASVKHYPNPFRDQVTLEFKLDLDADVEIMITDVNGKIVSRLSIDNLYRGIQTHSISTQDWVPGIYFYQALIKEQQTGILKRANGTLVKM